MSGDARRVFCRPSSIGGTVPSSNAIQPAGSDPTRESGRRRISRAHVAGTISLLILCQLPIGNLLPGKGLLAQVAQEAIFWILTGLLLAYVVFIERRPLSSIGLKRPTWKSVGWGVIGALCMVAGAAFIYLVIFPALGLTANETGLRAVQATPLWFQALLVVRAPVFEEVFYRGFAIERLTEITGMRWLAALISLAAFTLAHLSYWGWASLIAVAFQGGVLTILYLLRRDLGANMIAHFISDAVAFFLV
jgi:membrane protease YdiL (CAAX protease family)